jgi:hypothetical protein
LGLNGLVTPSISFLAMAGWASSFYRGNPNAQQFDSVIGQAELRWFMGGSVGNSGVAAASLSSMAIGYMRDFTNSYIGDYYTIDRGYANVSYSFNGRFILVLDGGVAAHEYPWVYYIDRTRPRHAPFTALYADASLFGEYRATDSFGINTTLRYSAAITDAAMQVGGNNVTPSSYDYLEWKRFEAYLGVRWFL